MLIGPTTMKVFTFALMTENNIPRHPIYEFISEDFIGK